MHLDKIELKDFRNYAHAEVGFSSGLNMIIGANGQGKTNLLEAVQVLCGAGSHRAGPQASLIRHGVAQAVIRGRGEVRERQVRVDAEIRTPGGVRLQVNGSALQAGSRTILPACVIFSPDDLALIKGGPEERRSFLDDTAAQIKPLAAAQKNEFERTLRQRNGVLKAAQFSRGAKAQLEIWTDQLASAAARVISNRLKVLQLVAAGLSEKYPLVAGRAAQVGILYRPTWAERATTDDPSELEEAMSLALGAGRERDLERGLTLAGPHRDDIEIELEGAAARIFASQGEQRSLALALRLTERDLLADARREPPILLLDDVFSELDEDRRRRVAEVVQAGGQGLITTTEPEALPLRAERVVQVAGGRVLPGA